VFYVVDREGEQIGDRPRRDEIVARLESAIAHLQHHGLSKSAVAATEDPAADESPGDA